MEEPSKGDPRKQAETDEMRALLEEALEEYEVNYGSYSRHIEGPGEYEEFEPPKMYILPGFGGKEYYFTGREIMEETISIIVMTISFSIALGRFNDWPDYLIPSFFAVFTGFFLHEMGHKIVAQNNDLWSEYRMHLKGLVLAFASSIIGLVIASPGYLDVQGNPSDEVAGQMSFAGPATNIMLAICAIPFFFIDGVIGFTAFLIIVVNSVLALFNLIPFDPMDGSRIWPWSPLHYVFIAGAGSILFVTFFFILETP
jgi:Zn-dependent protease